MGNNSVSSIRHNSSRFLVEDRVNAEFDPSVQPRKPVASGTIGELVFYSVRAYEHVRRTYPHVGAPSYNVHAKLCRHRLFYACSRYLCECDVIPPSGAKQ